MPNELLLELLEAGAHFGHHTQRWNPKMKKYIFGERNNIYIINLEITTELLEKACEAVKVEASKGKNIVFVGTKKQAVDIVKEEAERANCYYINRRWLGGTLTNFETIRARINKLRELEELQESGYFEKLPKKESANLTKQLTKLQNTLGGVKEMRGMPDMLFVVGQNKEIIAIQEANKLNIPVVCIVDTNSDPDNIDYVIPANDDAIRSIKLITSKIADAVIEGKKLKEALDAQNIESKTDKQLKAESKKAKAKAEVEAEGKKTKSKAKAETEEAETENAEAVVAE